jgi:cell wall-associated NlpC family hydrolase
LRSDARTTAARPDLAARWLEGTVPAARYVDPQPMVCARAVASIRGAPADGAEQHDQLLFGELFQALEMAGDWAWGQAPRDGYVGWVRMGDLASKGPAPTHQIAAALAHAYAEPDVRAPASGPFVLGSLLTEEAREGRFVKAAGAGWFVQEALSPIGRFATDPVAVAERLAGAPYLWGGRSSLGVDCSGLIQQALYACGRACPRDSDQQAKVLGRPIPAAAFGRGDLVFWKGHVALGLSPERVLHANSAAMAVSVDTLADALARNRSVYGEPVAWRRL